MCVETGAKEVQATGITPIDATRGVNLLFTSAQEEQLSHYLKEAEDVTRTDHDQELARSRAERLREPLRFHARNTAEHVVFTGISTSVK